MARALRRDLPDGIYHVTTRAVADTHAYRDDEDRTAFLALLDLVRERFGWKVHAFTVMGTHYHLVVETTRVLLSRGMQRLNGLHAQGFNHRHGRRGHLWSDRFVARLVDDEGYLRTVCGYVVRNPVAAGLCVEPEDLAVERLPLRRARGRRSRRLLGCSGRRRRRSSSRAARRP